MEQMSKYRHHKYTWQKPFGSVQHGWSLVGPRGAISFHATVVDSYPVTAGLEIHGFAPADYQKDDAPSQLKCDLTGGRCWHDGTSLYATETLWPMISFYLESGDHAEVFRVLEREADKRFYEEAE